MHYSIFSTYYIVFISKPVYTKWFSNRNFLQKQLLCIYNSLWVSKVNYKHTVNTISKADQIFFSYGHFLYDKFLNVNKAKLTKFI